MESIIREPLSTDDLADRLSTIVNGGDKVILNLKDNWYKIGVTELETVSVPTNAYYFDNVNVVALLAQLQSKVVFVTPIIGYSSLFVVDKYVYTPMDFWYLFHK